MHKYGKSNVTFLSKQEKRQAFSSEDLPEPPNWLLASVVGLFFPLATGGANIYNR